MHLAELQNLARLAMKGHPHVNPAETLRMLAVMPPAEREAAGKVCASLIGEPSVPVRITQKRSGSPARDVLNRRAEARRAIEARRDARV